MIQPMNGEQITPEGYYLNGVWLIKRDDENRRYIIPKEVLPTTSAARSLNRWFGRYDDTHRAFVNGGLLFVERQGLSTVVHRHGVDTRVKWGR